MRFSKTFCKPSATVSVVPAGLPVRLQYNEHGLLQKYDIGFSIDLDPMYQDTDVESFNYNELFTKIKSYVPTTIYITGGTTWVFGVFYSNRIPCDEGIIPQSLYKSYIDDMIAGGQYEFYAGYAHSLASRMQGPLVIRNFLAANKFNILPQVLVPVSMSDETLQMMHGASFNTSFIAGFFIYEGVECRYSSSLLVQIQVKNNPQPFVDADGYIKGEITTASGRTYMFDYSAIVHHGVTKGCTLLLERDSASQSFDIIATRIGSEAEKVPETSCKEVKCPVCGKIIKMGSNDAPIQCDDPHCLSHEYENGVKLLTTFNLPSLSYNSYKALVDSKKIICLTDLLELEPCRDIEIKATLAQAMSAVVPAEVVPNFNILDRFANKCNGNVETVIYYLQNPLRIETDLDIVDPFIKRFASWLEDPYNVTTLTTIFARVKIASKVQKFDGAPIFRGYTLAITGSFKRGNTVEIESILSSYAAKVVTNIEMGEDLPDVVIMGSLNAKISGELIHKAKAHNIPIMQEDDFFAQYEIDADLANNLL